jgi:RNA polymerase sigma-70 factor (ECF subfamily)
MSDKDSIQRCLKGEVEEFRNIVDRYSGPAMALALNVLRNREDAEDACQEAFIKALQNLNRLDLNKDFKNWFYTLLLNRCLDRLRKKKRFYIFYNQWKNETAALTSEGSSNPLPCRRWDELLMKLLTPKERASLFLWAQEGYSSEERACMLRCSPSTARVHLYKARKKIKTFLERENVEV